MPVTMIEPWKRHPNKELEIVLVKFHEWGWSVTKAKTYYSVKCPCPKKHKKWIHLTPSNSNYAKDTLAWGARQCKEPEGGQS